MDPHDSLTPGQAPDREPPARVPRRYVGPSASAPAPKVAEAAANPERKSPEARAWDKLLLLVGAAVVVAAILIVPGILNRGGQNPVAEAAQATLDSPGVRMSFTVSVSGAESMTLQGSGVLNGETKRAEIQMGTTGASGSPLGAFQMQEIVDGLDFYIRSPALSGALGGRSWMLVRAEAFGSIPQGSGGAVGAGLSSGPKQQLDALESASDNVTTVGREPVNGVETTHYSGVIDLRRLFDRVRDQLPSKLADFMEHSFEDNPFEQVDVWVDQQGLIRRERSGGSVGGATFTSTIDFSDYGIRPRIDVPPSSDVQDMTPLIERVFDSIDS